MASKLYAMHRKVILIADDDQDILDILTLSLINNGYHVRTAFNGEGLENLEHDLPDLLLLDVWMSGRNGKDVCMRLKQQEATKNLPIILISANHDLDQIALEAGADGYVYKPFNIKNLLEVVRQKMV